MNAKKAKALRRFIAENYNDPKVQKYVYKQAKKEINLTHSL